MKRLTAASAFAFTGIIALGGCSSSNSAEPTAAQSAEVNDAMSDVKIGDVIDNEETGGMTMLEVIITNSTNERSDYTVEVSASSPDGKTLYDSNAAYVINVGPGQTAYGDVSFTNQIPAGAKFAIVRADRISSTEAALKESGEQ